MEFDLGFQRAQSAHLACLHTMKKFWKMIYKTHKRGGRQSARVLQTVAILQTFDAHLTTAQQEYHTTHMI
jgi:hypothetical protein